MYAGQVLKDAIVDRLRERHGRRPDVDKRAPDVLINCVVKAGKCSLSVDTSGEPLFRRGYKQHAVEAPIQGLLAAAEPLYFDH